MPTPEEKILSQLQGAPRINPASARLFTDWTLEPGDVVTVRSTEGDSVRNYQLPIYSMDFNWNGSPMMEISSSGNKEREPLPELVRKEYAEATSSRGMGRRIADTEEEIRQYRTWQTKTDKKIGDYAEIMGVTIDPETGDVVYETDDQGNIRLDEDGNPIPVFDPTSPYSLYTKHEVTAQRIVNYVGLTGIRFDAQGNPIYKQAKDAQGNPIYDAQGNPVYETDSQGNPIPDLDAGDGHSMYSQISQTIGGIESTVSGHTGSISTLTQTATSLTTRIGTAEGNISTLQQTATNLTSRIETAEGYYSVINQNATSIGMVVAAPATEGGSPTIRAAAIAAAINANGSEAYISADHVYVTGTTLLSGQVTVDNGMFYVLTSLGVGNSTQGDIVSINNGKVSASTYDVKISGKINFIVNQGTHYELTAAKVKNLVTGFGTTARVGQTISIPYSTISSPEINANSPKIDLTVPDAIATITVDDNPPEGKIGFKYTTLSNSQAVAVNFNIADTQAYKDGVSAARNSVEVGLITWTGPTASDNQSEAHGKRYSLSATIPLVYQTGVDGQDEPVYTTIRTYGPISQNITGVYDAGWDNGSDSVRLNDTGWSSTNQRTISTVGRHTEEQSVTVSVSGVWDTQESSGTDAEKATAVYRILSAPAGTTPTDGNTLFTTSPVMSFQTYTNANHVLTAQLKAGNKLLASVAYDTTDIINDSKDSVTLTATNWSNGQRTFSTSGRHGTEVSRSVNLVGGTVGSYNSTENTLSFNIYDGTGDNSVDTGADVVAAVVPGTVTVTKGTYNAVTHLLPITATALPTVGTAAISISGSLDVPISGQWKFGSDGTGSAASENAMFGVYSGTTKLFGSSVTLVPSSGLVQLKEGTNVLAMVSVPTEADADIDVVGPSWNNYTGDLPTNRIATFSPSIGEGDPVELNLLLTTVSTWDSNHVKPVYLKPGSSSADPVARIDIDASGLYSEAQNSVNVTKDTWSINYSGAASAEANSVVFRPSVGTGTTKTLSVQISNDGNTFSNHKLRIYAHDVSDGATAAARNRICSFLVDATSEYTTGTTDGFTVCKNSVGLNYTADQTVQPGSHITVYPVVRSSYSDSSTVNLTAKSITISAAASTYLDQWLYGTGGNDEEANTGAFYRVYANDYQHPVKGTQVQLTHSQAGTTRLVDYANTTKVLAKIDNPKVSGIVTSGYQKIILAASDIGANVSKEVRVTYTDGLGEDRNIIIDAHAVYEAGQGSTALTGPTWNDYSGNTLPANRTATYKSGDTTAATLRLYLTTESTWTNHIKPVYLRPGSTSANAVARIDIDASGEYSAGQNSVEISTATLSNVVYNSSARSATAVLTVSLTNGKSKTYSDRVDVSTPYQAGLDGRSAVNTQSFRIKLTDYSGFEIDKTYAVNTKAIYDKGVEDATPVFEPVARFVWSEKNNGAIKFYKSSTGSTRWGTLEYNTRVWLLDPDAVNDRYYVAYRDGYDNEWAGYIPTQYVHENRKDAYGGGGWVEEPAGSEKTMYIYAANGEPVSVYSSASTSSEIGKLYPNTEVTRVSTSGTWTQIRVTSGGRTVKGYLQNGSVSLRDTDNSPSHYSLTGWVSPPQTVTVTGILIQDVQHNSGIFSSPLNVKMADTRTTVMREFTSTATQSAAYEAITTSGDPSDYLELVNTTSGVKYYAWHNSSTNSGDVGHKVRLAVSYSNGNTETVWINIFSKASSTYQYIS